MSFQGAGFPEKVYERALIRELALHGVLNPGQEQWSIFLEMAGRWRDLANRRGVPMSDRNNVQIADQMSKFLSEKNLD